MNWLEQLALLIVLGVVGVAAYVTNWALKLKKSAELKAGIEAQKRMEVELKHEINNKDIHDLVDESNKRHGLMGNQFLSILFYRSLKVINGSI